MSELLKLVDGLNDKIYDENFINDFSYYFNYSTNSCDEAIDFHIDGNNIRVLDDNSNRGWNNEKDDYERTEKEQIIFELEKHIELVNRILGKLK